MEFGLAHGYADRFAEFLRATEAFLRDGQYIDGPYVQRFEQEVTEYLGGGHAVGVASGTHALQLALSMAGVGPEDEVITVANTYYATAWAIKAVGARPVFCDIRYDNALIDPEHIEQLITPRTRAIVPVHLYGFAAPMADIRQISSRRGLQVIEDCAQAFGSSDGDTAIGARSEYACFSFYPTKSLGAFGDAGMIVTHTRDQADVLRERRYFSNGSRTAFDGSAQHARLDAIQACLLSVNLRYMPEVSQHRREMATIYRARLSDRFDCLEEVSLDHITPYVCPIRVADREQLLLRMREQDIPLQVHYSTNLHHLDEFGGDTNHHLEATERHNGEVISLPVHPSLNAEDAHRICDVILKESAL